MDPRSTIRALSALRSKHQHPHHFPFLPRYTIITMEMHMLSPEDSTHHTHILRLASGQSRRVSPGTPNPYAATYPVRNPYAQPAEPTSGQHRHSSSASHTPNTTDIGLDGTPIERTSRKVSHQSLPDVFPSTPELASEMSEAENQRTTEYNLHLELPEKAPSLPLAQENLEPIPQRRTSSHSHVQIPKEIAAPGSQPGPCQNSTGHHRPFTVFSNCCLISRHNASPATVPGISSGGQCGLEGDCETTDLHCNYPLPGTCCLWSHRSRNIH